MRIRGLLNWFSGHKVAIVVGVILLFGGAALGVLVALAVGVDGGKSDPYVAVGALGSSPTLAAGRSPGIAIPNGGPPASTADGGPPGSLPDGGPPGSLPDGGSPGGIPDGGSPGGIPDGGRPGGIPDGGPPGGIPDGGPPGGGSTPDGGPPEGANLPGDDVPPAGVKLRSPWLVKDF